MAYDANARNVGIHAIGAVEASMAYDALNSSDPITVGLFQWYATRAAGILNRMRTENPAAWTGIPSSLTNDLISHADTDSFWTTRYLTTGEGKPLKPVLIANISIQDDQAGTDLDAYTNVATGQGMDKDGNTHAVLFFDNMYNQSPRSALQVLATASPQAGIDRLYSVCLNHPILGQYKTRYKTAYDIIVADDPGTVGTGTATPDPHTGGNPSADRPETRIAHIKVHADTLAVRYKDGHVLFALPTGHGYWTPQADSTMGSDVPVPPDGTPPTDSGSALHAWLVAHHDHYAYSQGASRLTPDLHNYTDCSGLMYWVYEQVCTIYVGTWTGEQCKKGTLVTTSPTVAKAETQLAVGDLVFYRWSSSSPSTFDHVAMYVGSNTIESHGGPDNGPDAQSHSGEIDYAIGNGGTIMVRRYLAPAYL